MRLLIVSHSACTPINQKLYGEVACLTGWKLSLVIPSNFINEYGKLCAPELLAGVDAKLIPIPIRRSRDVILHWYKSSITRLLREENPDAIYVNHEPYAVATAQVYLANARSVRKPIGFYSCQNIAKQYPPPFRWTESMVLNQSKFFFPISSDVDRVFRDKGYRGQSTILPLGIDPNVYFPSPEGPRLKAALQKAPGELLLGYVGRVVEEKGLLTLLKAMKLVGDRHFRLVVIGSGVFDDEFNRQASELGLTSRITRLGFIPHSQTAAYLSALDVLVLPSETRQNWKEQFGRVLIEAMACGTPVIGSDSGEIPTLVRSCGGGVVFHEADPRQLADKIIQMIDDPGLRSRCAAEGRTQAVAKFSIPNLATIFACAIEGILAGGGELTRPGQKVATS